MDKDGSQIIHEEQLKDQDQNEDKLPSKWSRRLLTTRRDNFLWSDSNMNHYTGKILKTSKLNLNSNELEILHYNLFLFFHLFIYCN
jgi:hypothetical protein